MNPILWPREQARYNNDDAIELWVNGQQVSIVSTLPDFIIPDNPTWSEDPFSSRVWSAYYQSLGWIYAAEAAFKAGQFDEFPAYAKSILLDFMTDNDDVNAPTHRLTYHDGANAFRLATISYLYETYFKEGNAHGIHFTDEELAIFKNSLIIQRDQVLYQLSKDEHWDGNNHRFFHSMALTSYASVFGSLDPSDPLYEPNAATYLEDGLDIVEDTLASIISTTDGATIEQSFTYHRLAIGLVLEAVDSVESAGYQLDVDYSDLLARMYEFDLLTARPGDGRLDLYVSEVGDTYYGALSGSFYINQLVEAGVTSPLIAWIKSQGATGERPADLNVFADAGYAVIRAEYEWENERDLRVLVDASPSRHSHGHYDNSNVLLSLFGEKILVDSGGPYSYDNKNDLGYDFKYNESLKEFYFVTSEAHNVVVVDGFSSDGDTRIRATADEEDYSLVSISRDFTYVPSQGGPAYAPGVDFDAYVAETRANYDPIELLRDVLVLKEAGITLVFDTVKNYGTDAHDYELNWHFDPAAIGVDASSNVDFSVDDVYVDAAFVSSVPGTTYTVKKGEAGEEMQGWVTPKLYTIKAAPVLELYQNDVAGDAWFVSAFAGALQEAVTLELDVVKTATGFLATVTYGDTTVDIVLGPNGEVSVDYEDEPAPGQGTSGDDRLVGTSAAEIFDAKDGNDIVFAGGGNDTVNGDGGDDRLYGEDGDDVVSGGSGNDILYGEAGNNTLNGDAGDDRLIGDIGRDLMNGGDGIDTLYGFAGIDTITGGNGADVIKGGDNTDFIDGGADNDKILGEAGNDQITGGAGLDTIRGGNGHDSVRAGEGDDYLFGEANNDTLYGDAGADRIHGGAGDDILIGGADADVLYGEQGIDIFRFAAGDSKRSAVDQIVDFTRGVDLIDLAGMGFGGVQAGAGAGTQLGIVYVATSDRYLVSNADRSFQLLVDGTTEALTDSDFIFA